MREARAIGGLSMGGYGAIKLALQHPDLFASAHSHSGALDFGHGWRSDFIDVTSVLGDDAGGGGPNDCYKLAAECRQPPAVWIDCGTDDFLIDQNRSFHAHLDKLKFAHTYHEFRAPTIGATGIFTSRERSPSMRKTWAWLAGRTATCAFLLLRRLTLHQLLQFFDGPSGIRIVGLVCNAI